MDQREKILQIEERVAATLSVNIAHLLNAAPHNPETCAECQDGEHVTVEKQVTDYGNMVPYIYLAEARGMIAALEKELAELRGRTAERDASVVHAIKRGR